MKNIINLVNIGSWNIHGLFDSINKVKLCKLKDEEFVKRLHDFDILCLQEIQCGPSDTVGLSVEGYLLKPFHRTISKNNRHFGGSLILVKKSVQKGVKFVRDFKGDVIWIKLEKSFFGFEKDVYFCFAYAPPSNSSYLKNNDLDILEKVEEDISLYSNLGNIMIAGDFNAKTKTENDYISDKDDDHSPINHSVLYQYDDCFIRQNCDLHPVDEQGRKFLELCKNSRIRILNGRMPGDRLGTFTRHPRSLRETPSTLDYMAADLASFKNIKSFTVLPHLGLSDHECLKVVIKTKIESQMPDEAIKITKDKHVRYATQQEFSMKLNSTQGKKKIEEYIKKHNVSNANTEGMYSDLIEIINSFSHKPKIRVSANKSKKKIDKSKPWYETKCRKLKNNLNRKEKNYRKNQFDTRAREELIKARKDFKSVCRQSEKTFRDNLTKQLYQVEKSNLKNFGKQYQL